MAETIREDVQVRGNVAWTDYSATSTIVGWGSYTTKLIYYRKRGNTVYVSFLLLGVSNSASTTFTLPFTSSNTVETNVAIRAMDNGTAAVGLLNLPANSSTVTCYSTIGAATWTSSGTKRVAGEFWYQTT